MNQQKLEAVKQKIIEAVPEIVGRETTKDWEENFYESDWTPDTIVYSKEENELKERLGSFLPRHMPVYDWNLPYIDEIILEIRRVFAREIQLADVLVAMDKQHLIYSVDSAGIFFEYFSVDEWKRIPKVKWDLSKPYSEQSPELIDYLYDVLCSK